jgi:hypothetical protein
MKVYTLSKTTITPGVEVWGGNISLGESGRGRQLTTVPVPLDRAVIEGTRCKGTLMEITGTKEPGCLLVIRDQSGFRGSWTYQTTARILAKGWCAQGDAGRMGGGPELLIHIKPGESVEITRTGRLYGEPARIRVVCREDCSLMLLDPAAADRTQAAGDALKSL